MPPRARRTTIGHNENPVAEQLENVAAELRVIRDVLDELRNHFHWIATNGVPRWQPSIDDRDPTTLSADLHRQEPRTKSAPRSREVELVHEVIERLETGIASIATDQLALFVDALDGVRDDLVAALKGNPQQSLQFDDSADRSPVEPQPVLETGSVTTDACEQSKGDTAADVIHDAPPQATMQRSLFGLPESAAIPRVLFDPGDAVYLREFNDDGSDGFGEIVSVDDAYNTATVELIPSEEHVTVSQDILAKAELDSFPCESSPPMPPPTR